MTVLGQHLTAPPNIASRAALIASLRARRRYRPAPIEITCETVRAIPYQDVIDLYLGLSGARQAVWRDPEGRTEPVQPPLQALRNIAWDALVWPALVAGAYYRLRLLAHEQPRERLALRDTARVLYLRTDHWFNVAEGGALTHATGVINGLRATGRTVHLVTTRPLPRLDGEVCEPDYHVGRNVPNVPILAYRDQLAAFLADRWESWKPDFVYHRLSLLSTIGPLLRRTYRVPYVCEYNGSIPWIARHWDRRHLALSHLAGETERLSLLSADLVIAVSEAASEELLETGVMPDRILLCPNGVDFASFAGADGDAVRQRLGVRDKFVVGFVGTFGRWHGADILAQAFVELRARRPDLRDRVRLLMIGEGLTRPAVETVLRVGNADEAAILPGLVPQTDISGYLAASDVLVSPHAPNPDGSRFAGSPTKLFEYMASGRAIIASDLEQIGTILSHGNSGWLVEPGDAGAIATGIEVMADNPRLRRRLGEAAREGARREHDWSARVNRILAALPRMAGT